MYASVIVNDMPVGTFQVERYPGGDFAIRKSDLVAMGIEKPVGQMFSLDGEDFLLLSTLETSKFRFDERHVEIAIEIDPNALRSQVIDARHRVAATNVFYPRDTSAFFNYSLSHDTIDYTSDTVSGELGIRHGDFLFLTDGFYERTEYDDRSIRLRTSLTHSNRETLQETVVGDFIATSGALGSNLNLGGISFSKNYRMDPYLVRFPFASYSGLAQTPARYEVLVNGTRVSTGTLDPGPFDITNIQGPLGVANVEVVVRDAFGREQVYSTPFYFTQAALRQGLSEYSFGLGRQRQQFGLVSNDYGPVAGTGFYRYGITDALTLGARAEASEEIFNLGPNVTLLAGQWGLFNTTLSYSNDSENDGYAGVFDYAIQARKFNASASVLAQSRHYARVGIDQVYNTRFEARTAFSWGPYTLTYNTLHPYQGVDRTSYGVSVTPRLPNPRVSLFASIRRIEDERSGTEFYIGVNYYFRDNYSVSGAVRTFDDDHQASATIQKAIPVGEGWGFSAQATEFDDSRGNGYSLRPYIQYNARHATLVADYQQVSEDGEKHDSKHLALQGSISAVGGNVILSRPITDAFALVQVDGLEGVDVYQGSQYTGTTDKKGRLLIPSLGSYVNTQIAVDSRDIPLDFELRNYTRLISPALRGGAVLDFGARKIRAVTGVLNMRRDGQAVPVKYGEISLMVDGQRTTHPVGQAGDFFIENLKPGSYNLSYVSRDGACSVTIAIPDSDESIIDLGKLLCVPD